MEQGKHLTSKEGLFLPYRVITREGTFAGGSNNKELAERHAAALNDRAKAMGLQARYEVVSHLIGENEE